MTQFTSRVFKAPPPAAPYAAPGPGASGSSAIRPGEMNQWGD